MTEGAFRGLLLVVAIYILLAIGTVVTTLLPMPI